MKTAARRVAAMPETIFARMTALAVEHEAVNLGQGFPDFAAPDFVKQAAIEAIAADRNQYAPGNGLAELRCAVADLYHRRYGLDFDPAAEVLVTVGATEAIFAAMLGLLDPGDEVILFDPAYDSYRPAAGFSGATTRSLVLQPPDWRFNARELEALVTPATRLLVLNSPHNPTGKVYSEAELEAIADLCRRHDLVALTDEVYEYLCYDGVCHRPLATYPGMRERTLTVSSFGKSFGVTGWKVGWVLGPADLVASVLKAKQFMTFCGAAPLQAAAVAALQVGGEYFDRLAKEFQQRRDFLCDALTDCGFEVFMPAAGYFVVADIGPLSSANAMDFCERLPREVGVAAIPAGPFYADPAEGRSLVRFAFCKSRPVLEEGVRRLRQHFG